MSFAVLYFSNGDKKTVTPEKGLIAYNLKHGITTPTDQQAQYIHHISRVFLPPSVRPMTYSSVLPQSNRNPLKLDVRPLQDINSRHDDRKIRETQGFSDELDRRYK